MNDEAEKNSPSIPAETETLEIDLRDPRVAVFLGWLVPGLGHLYQRRTAKGLMFLICVWGTFFVGMYLGDHKVVYASNVPGERRLAYLCQIGVGVPSVVALVQAYRMGQNPPKAPLGNYMLPPRGNDLHDWHEHLHGYFELGTVFTMIAGLLNVLVMYDAWAGPLLILADKDNKQSGKEESEVPPGDG